MMKMFSIQSVSIVKAIQMKSMKLTPMMKSIADGEIQDFEEWR
jgi:hypothetical protein